MYQMNYFHGGIFLHAIKNSNCLACWWIVQIITPRRKYFLRATTEGNCYTSPYVKSHLIIHPISQKEWNNCTSR